MIGMGFLDGETEAGILKLEEDLKMKWKDSRFHYRLGIDYMRRMKAGAEK